MPFEHDVHCCLVFALVLSLSCMLINLKCVSRDPDLL